MIRRPLHTAFTITISAFALSGCSLLETLDDLNAIQEITDDIPNFTTPTEGEIPTSGTSDFEGGLVLGNDTGDALLTDLNANVNFGTGDFSGSATDIRLIDATAETWQEAVQAVKTSYSGSADWNGSITGTSIVSNGSGTISADGTNYTLTFTADGDLYLDGEGVLTMGSASGVSGTLTAEGGSTSDFSEGGFYAKRQ